MNPTFAVFRLAAWLLPRLPARVVAVLGPVAGWSAWLINGQARQAVRSNLRVVLQDEPSSAQVRAAFVTAAQNYCDLFYLPRLADDDVARRVEVDGWENLAAALAQGRGALLASLHLGNIEVVGRAAAVRGIKIVVPVERVEPPELLDLMLNLRRRAGLICEPVGEHAFERIREALHRNAIVGIGADRVTLGAGELVTFCGKPARMPIAAAIVALRTGAPLLPYASRRLPGHRFRLQIGAPIPVQRSGHVRADARAVTTRLLAVLGAYLSANPTQWVVFRPIWNAECSP